MGLGGKSILRRGWILSSHLEDQKTAVGLPLAMSVFSIGLDNSSVQGGTMKSHRVVGGGGTQLHVIETGNPNGRPILFVHGFSQCGLTWSRQLASDLANDFRLLAMDMRGHGLSDKPQEGYSD